MWERDLLKSRKEGWETGKDSGRKGNGGRRPALLPTLVEKRME